MARIAERKTVSVLFVDLVGFTGRADEADPEDIQATLEPYRSLVKREIDRYGGTVEKFIGDAVMAVFGAPVVHEDDAERAVRAALDILHDVESLNREQQDQDLAIRVAVNTGEALVAIGAKPEAGEGIVTGDVVNTASRLQQIAPVGGAVVGEATYRATRGSIEYAEMQPVVVKGKAKPIHIWQPIAARNRLGVEVEQRAPIPLVGREAELRLLQDAYRRAVRESSMQLVTITGEPGVGKTRLVREFSLFVDAQPDLVWWRQGRCLPYGDGITFWALGEIVKAQAGILESDGPEAAAAKLFGAVEPLIEDGAEKRWVIVRLEPLIGLSSESTVAADRREAFTAWRRFLEGLASSRPLVLVFEDIHWADPAMLEFIEHLTDRTIGVPMVIVCTGRPELYERATGWGGGKKNAATIALSPLSDDETARLLSALLGPVLPPDTQQALLERAGGNPLYAEEFARMLVDRGLVEHYGDGWMIAAPDAISLPDTIQALVSARLDTLSAELKALIQDAAVVGKVFWSGALATMGGLDATDVEEGMYELTRKELVRPIRSSSVKNEGEYAFWHILIRDVAYGQIPRAARADSHRKAAEWIEDLAGERVADVAEQLAHHYAQALDLARASGQREAEPLLVDRAAKFFEMSGDRTLQLEVAKARDYFTRALELVPKGDPRRGRLSRKAAGAALQAGEFGPSERMLEEAISLFAESGDVRSEGESLVWLTETMRDRGDTAKARELLARAVTMLEGEAPGQELAWAYAAMARDLLLVGRSRDGVKYAKKTLALAKRLELPDLEARARQLRGWGRCQLGEAQAGIRDLREGLAMCLELGLAGHVTARSYNNLGAFTTLIEGPAAALSVYREGIAFALSRGMAHLGGYIQVAILWANYELGDWDSVLRDADEMIESDLAQGGRQRALETLALKVRVLADRGRAAEAMAFKDDLVRWAREVCDIQLLGPGMVSAALLEEAGGHPEAGAGLIEELLDRVGGAMPTFVGALQTTAAGLAVRAGKIDLAKRLVDSVDPVLPYQHCDLLSARAVLTEAEGRLDEALDLYRQAYVRWATWGSVPQLGQTRIGAGRCLARLGRAGEAAEEFTEARRIFERLGATPWIEEVERWIRHQHLGVQSTPDVG